MFDRCTVALFAGLAMMTLSACSTSSSANRPPAFPSRAEVAKIAAQPAPDVEFQKKTVSVEKWDLSGPLPSQIGLQARQAVSTWDNALINASKHNAKHVVSEGATCVARETGRFLLAKRGYPHGSLKRFIESRCGMVSATMATYAMYDTTIKGDMSEEEIYKQIAPTFEKTVKQNLSSARAAARHYELGVWFGKEGNRFVLMISRGYRVVDLQAMPMKMDAQGKIVIRGKALVSADVAYGIMNKGDYGMAYCITNPKYAMPSFEIECQGQPGDRFAAFRIGMSKKKLIFSKNALSQMVWSATEPQATFEASAIHKAVASGVENKAVSAPELMPERLLKLINHVRKTRQLKPLTLSKAQSQTAMKIAPQLLNPKLTEAETDKIFRGLIAGWDVKSSIVDGNFLTDMSGAQNMVDVVTGFLDGPMGRQLLMKRDASIMAVGAVQKDGQLGLVVMTYKKLKKASHNRRVAIVAQRINDARRLKGLGSIQRLHSFNTQAEKAAKRLTKGASLKSVASSFASTVRDGLDTNVSYFMLELNDLDDVSAFKEFVVPRTLRAAIVVAPVKQSDHPWTTFRVIIVLPSIDMKR